jgi:hypothetical protein
MIGLLLDMAGHRDAMSYGFIEPKIYIHPNGEIDVNETFYRKTILKYASKRQSEVTQHESEKYDDYFSDTEAKQARAAAAIVKYVSEMDPYFIPEFGFSSNMLLTISDALREKSIEVGKPGLILTEELVYGWLTKRCAMSSNQMDSFINRFSLPIRRGWNVDMPLRCKDEDVYPWRFRRQLSLLSRPFIQISSKPRAWLVSAPLFEKCALYIWGNIHEGRYPERFFLTEAMRSYIGAKVSKDGRDFELEAERILKANGYSTENAVPMSKLGAPKKDGLGDIDVLGWSVVSGIVFVIECKKLQSALTTREIVQRLEEFAGDRKSKDALGRHLRRVDWIRGNIETIENLTGIEKTRIKLIPLLVTSETVPMQFYEGLHFPSQQVVSVVQLSDYIRSI